ncbi:MAG: DUF4349 domain-containing protein [Clostridia bacterium]|nr:DUF4349 domain-containing protein [Clostridia bacterium]
MKLHRISAIFLASLILLTSCGAKSLSTEAYDAGMDYVTAETAMATTNGFTGGTSKPSYSYAADYAEPEAPMEEIAAEESASESGGTNDLTERKIIKTANLEFETKTYDEFVETLIREITTCGGYIANQSSRGGGEYSYNVQRYANLTVRIPAADYDRFMEKASDMGSLTYKSESTDDVTMSYVDTESHIRALETEYEALLTILEKASNLDDVIQLQSRITEVNYQLDSYKSQLRKYDDLIAYCTVHISVSEVYRETAKSPEVLTFGQRIAQALEHTFLNIADDAQDFAVDFIAALPYLCIWAVVIVLALIVLRVIWRKAKRRYEVKKLDKLMKQAEKKDNNA